MIFYLLDNFLYLLNNFCKIKDKNSESKKVFKFELNIPELLYKSMF